MKSDPEPTRYHRLRQWILRLWRDMDWLKPFPLLGAAIVATIFGDIVFQIVTGDAAGWGTGAWIGRLALLLCAYLLTVVLVPIFALMFGDHEKSLQVGEEVNATPTPALIVIASSPAKPEEGPHRTAVDNFFNKSTSVLTHLFIIHSDDKQCLNSTGNLEAYANSRGVIVRTEGLLADYDDPKAMYEVARKAISLAIAEVTLPERVTLDVTGGSKMASVGAAMTKVDHDQVWLGYIPNVWSDELKRSVPGNIMKQIDVSWAPVWTAGVPSDNADHAQDVSTKGE